MTTANNNDKKTWAQTLAVYRDRRMAKILLLGFMSGLPWLLIGGMANQWLKEEGVSRTGIGLFGLVGLVYAINLIWAPAVDGVRIPWLTNALGRRRAWIIAMQGIMLCALIAIFFIPGLQQWDLVVNQHGGITAALPQVGINLWFFALVLFVIATAGATQDIAIDALRIELIGRNEGEKVGAGAAMATSGWFLAFAGTKLVAFNMVGFWEGLGVVRAWQTGYAVMGAVVVLSSLMLLFFVRESNTGESARDTGLKSFSAAVLVRRLVLLYWLPLRSFFGRYGLWVALMLLFFIFFFKVGEAFLGRMSIVFYNEIGFKRSDIALYSGGFGTVAFCVFAIMGSVINARYGLFRGIVVGGIAMASTNFLFAALYYYPEKWLFAFAVVADQFTTAVSTVAFVAFLSQLCDRHHTATQYAAFASLGNLSRTTLAVFSGALVDGLGGNWSLFFVITVLMVIPSLIILTAARKTLTPIMQGKTTTLI